MILIAVRPSLANEPPDAKRQEFFEAKIRPVLIKYCYECHSESSKPVQGGLRVDAAEAFRRGGDSGSPFEGQPSETLLIEALRYESLEMPPDEKLPERVVKDFERWLADGAFDPRVGTSTTDDAPSIEERIEAARTEWAFRRPRREPPPQVMEADWSRHWIDRRVQAAREAQGLRPVGDADREVLARRLYFDLTGLPPTPEQLRQFLDDPSPDAYPRLVDRLLAAPAFGEQWGRMWLDVARYADSNGGDFNATFHEAWRYRNYVIRTFNQDRPFDAFIREQLAGDLLPAETNEQASEQLVATGFLMLGPKMLSERDKAKLEMDVVDEQIDSVGRAFLGLTLGCARCHDHKFDPISTSEYYGLAGIFRSTQTLDGEIQKYVSNWTRQPLPVDPAHREAVKEHEQRLKELNKQLADAKKTVQKQQKLVAEAEAKLRGDRWIVDDVDAKKTGEWKKSTYSQPYFGAGYVHDDNKDKGKRSIRFEFKPPVDGEYEIRVAYTGSGGRAGKVPVVVEHAKGSTEIELNQKKVPSLAPFEPIGRFQLAKGQTASVTLLNRGTQGHVIADAVEFLPPAKFVKRQPPGDREPLLAAQQQLATVQEAEKQLQATVAELKKNAPAPLPKALAPREAKEIGDCHICVRGEHQNLGDVAPRRFLQVATVGPTPSIPEDRSGRLELAEWIADGDHPLTARVIANRVWQRMLGAGIVRSVDNFGRLGDPPTHPQLLDELAIELVQHNWSIKHLVRQIALSRTYQMSSSHDAEATARDPSNRLLWRAHRKPITAESIRDAMLLVSGQLQRTVADSPVANLGTLVTKNNPDDKGYTNKTTATRTLYTPIIRNELPPLLTVFDFADPDFVVGRRPTTTTPAQSLLMLNSPFVRETATKTAERVVDEAQEVESNVTALYQTLFGRSPSNQERRRAIEFLLSSENEPSATEDPNERTRRRREAWTQLTHAMLASTEFRMVD